jgi:hypothetical protein
VVLCPPVVVEVVEVWLPVVVEEAVVCFPVVLGEVVCSPVVVSFPVVADVLKKSTVTIPAFCWWYPKLFSAFPNAQSTYNKCHHETK